MSYAARATRFLAERRGLVPVPDPVAASDGPHGAAVAATANDIDDVDDVSPPEVGVWWPDPTVTPPPHDADGWDRQTRGAYAPVLRFPPRGCFAPRACSRLGACARRRDGRPCAASS